MQLETLISSLIENWDAPNYSVDIIYNYSTPDYAKGYEIFANRFRKYPVRLHREAAIGDRVSIKDCLSLTNLVRMYRIPKLRCAKSNFRSLLIKIIETSKAKNVMFLTDDSMFVKRVNISDDIINWINSSPKENQFSLRLGNGKSGLPENVTEENGLCSWNMYKNTASWGYPFSVDAHIYNKQYILKLLKKYVFVNPNTLEACIMSSVYREKKLRCGKCFSEIKMLTFPINIVQDTIENICQQVSVEMLNKRYICGETLRYGVVEDYDATKQYVKELFFYKNGNVEVVRIYPTPTL